jgi:hypothetical protein
VGAPGASQAWWMTQKSPGHVQFGRALYELNVDGICAK